MHQAKPVTIASAGLFLRWKVSSAVEPPLDCQVLEKPCTLILLEDSWLYHSSWEQHFQVSIPSEHGMAYMSLTLNTSNNLEDMIEEMKQDLSPIHDAVLVTRGPIATWVALFYLESLSLKGLIMIDPIPFDSIAHPPEKILQDLKQISTSNNLDPMIIQQACSKKLKLEPNSVPMMVIRSTNDDNFAKLANQMAQRHSDPNGPFGLVETIQISQDQPDVIMEKIDSWIESIL
jgi:hypothetical protein